ncbi:MAG: SDR family NAD(P)-dependent oxidoreductase, partial [Marinobacter sp.]
MSERLDTVSNIWITGASSGIGESVTHALIRGGHKLVVTGRRPEPLEQIKTLA